MRATREQELLAQRITTELFLVIGSLLSWSPVGSSEKFDLLDDRIKATVLDVIIKESENPTVWDTQYEG